jgi:hypothetical protein
VPLPTRPVPEQHRGTRRPRHQTTGPGQPGIPLLAISKATIQGIETMNMILKGQVRWLAKGDIAGQVAFVSGLLGLATAA